MLKPSFLEQLPARLIELYSESEMEIIAYMAERIAAQEYFTSSSYWQYQKLIEMGNFHSFIIKALSSRTGLTEKEIDRLMEEAGFKALKFDTDIYRAAGLAPPDLASSAALQQVLKAGSDQTKHLFENLTRTTANTVSKQFENALDKAWLNISSGAFDYNSAIEMSIKDLTDKGLKVVDYPQKLPNKKPHSDYLDVAVRRAAVTGVNQTAAKLQETLADELDSDLVETTAHSGARPSHAEWQGKVFSRSGTHKKYPHFATATGYGTGAGLCGWNCRHSFFPFFEGMDPVYTQDELDELNAKNIEYDGKKYTEYEISQIQRSYERGIRKSKREIVAAKAADLPEMQKKAEASLAQYQARQAALIKQTGVKRQYERERVISGGIPKAQAKSLAKASDYLATMNSEKATSISADGVFQNINASQVGKQTLNQLQELGAKPILIYGKQPFTHRGEQQGKIIKIYMDNVASERVAAQTVIHETTHLYYNIGQSQWAETVCFAKEKMHIENRTSLTISEKRRIIKIAKDNYPEFQWKRGGYGHK